MVILGLLALATSYFLTPVVAGLAWKLDAVSRPDGTRRTHARPTPELGGLGVLGALTVAVLGRLFLADLPPLDWHLLLGLGGSASLYCLLGLLDDKVEMRARTKLAGQFLAVAPLLLAGRYFTGIELLGWTVPLGYLGIPATVCWVVLIVNAMNLIDGMDGQASSIGIVGALTVAAIAFMQDQFMVATMGLGLAAGLFGFLLHNLPPAKIYLGDCGSLVLGFLLAVLAMEVSPTESTLSLSLAAPLLFLPIFDLLLAVSRRLLAGEPITHGDRLHIHHRILDKGVGVWAALAIVMSISLYGGVLALVSAVFGWHVFTWGAMAALVALCIKMRLAGHTEVRDALRLLRNRWSPRSSEEESAAPAPVLSLVEHDLPSPPRKQAVAEDLGKEEAAA